MAIDEADLRAAARALSAYRYSDTAPFCSSPADFADDCLSKAYSLLTTVGAMMDELADRPGEHIGARPCHVSGALDAAATFIALSAFAQRCIEAGRAS